VHVRERVELDDAIAADARAVERGLRELPAEPRPACGRAQVEPLDLGGVGCGGAVDVVLERE